MVFSSEELDKAAAKVRASNKANLLAKYHIARGCGFSASEAVVLMGKSREVIRSIAIARGFLKEGEGLPDYKGGEHGKAPKANS